MPPFKLRFPSQEIQKWSARFSYGDSDVTQIGQEAAKIGFLSRNQFAAIVGWKTRNRQKGRALLNAATYVEEVTRISFSTSESRLKIEVLRLLDGVQWPTASAILHFCEPDHWPILDYRALWSLSQPDDQRYDFELWSSYTEYTRKLATQSQVSMRTLDRALWAYSKANQR